MPSGGKRPEASIIPIERAFDELRFGAARTLNLRDRLPTVAQAEARVEAWLRRQQAEGSDEVLVITGRGLGSLDGVGKVRDAVLRKCTRLKRLNVVTAVREHGPGALVITLGSLRDLVAAPRLRTGRKTTTPPADPSELAALPAELRALLRDVATLSIHRLGVAEPSDEMIAGEMRAQFATLAPSVVGEPDRLQAMHRVASSLLQQLRED
jgi:Smr domain